MRATRLHYTCRRATTASRIRSVARRPRCIELATTATPTWSFHATVLAVWGHFLSDETEGFQHNQKAFYQDCGLDTVADPNANQTNACIIQHIVRYNSKVLGGQIPGQVQALLRGVAYDPDVSAVAYSFSIDDKYGTFRDASSGFVVDAGGTTALLNKQPYDPYQQCKLNWGYNRDVFGLVSLAPGDDLARIEPQLQILAQQNQNRPLLIRQGNKLAVLGHGDGTSWKLTDPLVTEGQLQKLAQQEALSSRGKTHVYQDVIDHTLGGSTIFPAAQLNVNAPTPQSIGTLDFDASADWAAGQALLYDFISQQHADIPAVGNWVNANVCVASMCRWLGQVRSACRSRSTAERIGHA